MNLDEVRSFVRTQLDLDPTDLPDTLLDVYVQDGFDRTIAIEQRWPFYESLWTATIGVDGKGTMPVDARVIEELIGVGGRVLMHVDFRYAAEWFGTTTPVGNPQYWTTINRQLRVWPAPSSPQDLSAHGYRMSADWIRDGASAEVDADRRLHIPVCWYACSLGYAQQEDEVLEGTYLGRFKESASIAREAIMRPWSGQVRQAFYRHYPRPGSYHSTFGWGDPAGPGGVTVP